jgi:hypothetical protein
MGRPAQVSAPKSCFAGFRFPPEAIILAVRWYLRCGLSYQDVEELLAKRGIPVDHVTIYRWVQRFTPLLAEATRPCRHEVDDRWWVDETYVKVSGQWCYVYRAIDQFDQIIDVYLSQRRDTAACHCFAQRNSARCSATRQPRHAVGAADTNFLIGGQARGERCSSVATTLGGLQGDAHAFEGDGLLEPHELTLPEASPEVLNFQRFDVVVRQVRGAGTFEELLAAYSHSTQGADLLLRVMVALARPVPTLEPSARRLGACPTASTRAGGRRMP